MYQKEFADRMVAKPGSKNYSRLSVGVFYKANCEILETVSKNCFKPKPKVDSSVIRLYPKKSPPFSVVNEKLFFELTNHLFNHRRKKIKNTINEVYKVELKDFPYLENRVEELSPFQISEISNILIKLLNS
jgi:16S rRNA (adenine1518-N6/adenine1519-N6)-dimethyltransferase